MIRINLLKPETKELKKVAPAAPEAKVKKGPSIGSLIFLLLVVVLAGIYWLQKKSLDNESQLLEKARQEKTQLAYVTAKLEELNKQKTSLERKLNLISSLKADQDLAVRILDELSRCLPEWIWLTEATYDAKGIQVKGNALSNNLIADYMTSLEMSPVFKNVNLGYSNLKKDQRNEYLEFSLNMAVEKPEPQAPAPGETKPVAPVAKKGGGQ